MALIKCPECEKLISEKAEECPNCGFPLSVQQVTVIDDCEEMTQIEFRKIESFVKIRFWFGVSCLFLAGLFFLIALDLEPERAQEMFSFSFYLIFTGLFGISGKRNKGLTITSVIFYSISVLCALSITFKYPECGIVLVVLSVFLILVCVSLSCKNSFR